MMPGRDTSRTTEWIERYYDQQSESEWQRLERHRMDGLPYRVPSLKEDPLAYIRRGRLDRAALCLPYCNNKRLGRLLRAKQVARTHGELDD